MRRSPGPTRARHVDRDARPGQARECAPHGRPEGWRERCTSRTSSPRTPPRREPTSGTRGPRARPPRGSRSSPGSTASSPRWTTR
ncbi:hypothetical protein FB00_03540 [Cellulosimicrobium funkei]|uniref:Uncharacterized protein n=1 Tax=Cellulosimicrobium funkei TaxID=264251 RepID=A0A0H2KSH1_9MICO|nr:hypothetical protein FB00_03540 [Cellulosimicrobium funkei]